MALKPLQTLTAALALSALAAAPFARAGSTSRDTGMPTGESEAQRAVKVDASTRALNVEHLETVRFEDAAGQTFTWTFNTPGDTSFPLQRIAPQGFAAGFTVIRVEHPWSHRWLAN